MCGGRQKHPPNHDAVSLPPSPPKCGMFASLVNMTRDEILIFGAPQKLILPPPRNLLPPPSMAEEGDEAKRLARFFRRCPFSRLITKFLLPLTTQILSAASNDVGGY